MIQQTHDATVFVPGHKHHKPETRPIVMAPHHVAECVDLPETLGPSFRYGFDPSYEAERPEFRAAERAWLTVVPCRHGHIFPHGGRLLAASTDVAGGIARKLMALACCALNQGADDGISVLFDTVDFEQVAAIMKPRRRRKLSTDARAKLVESGRAHRFDPECHGVQAPKSSAERVSMDAGV